jgi:Domain of unknown function (DUF6487)
MTNRTLCPECGGELEQGFITGQMKYLSWTKEGERPGNTTWGQEHLAKGSFTTPPMLPAARCGSCGLGLFDTDVLDARPDHDTE